MTEDRTTTLEQVLLELQGTGIKIIPAVQGGRFSVLGRAGNHVDTVNTFTDAVSLARKLRDEAYRGGMGVM